MVWQTVMEELNALKNPVKIQHYNKYFSVYPGGDGEGDIFLGISVPEQRKIAKKYVHSTLEDINHLLTSSIHEHRFVGLVILLEHWKKADKDKQKVLSKFYVDNLMYVNHWDLVDLSATTLVGKQSLQENNSTILYELMANENIWYKRVSILASWAYIKEHNYKHTLVLAEAVLDHPHHLLHKAAGWMLREISKKDETVLTEWLEINTSHMPRTMLRYSIEKFSEEKRKYFLSIKQVKNK